MSKSVISKTTELANVRKKYRRHNVVQSLVVFLVILIIYFAYIFMAIAAKGYGGKGPLFIWSDNTKWIGDLFVYFDCQKSILELFKGDTSSVLIYRASICGGVIVLSVFLSWLYSFLHGRKLNKKYQKKYVEALVEEVKINGLTLDMESVSTDESETKVALSRSNVEKAVKQGSLALSSPSMTWTGTQYNYQYNDQKRNGYLIQTTLTRARTNGLIQFRTFGKPTMSDYEGEEIKKYGFAENPKMSEYVCYTSLGQDIYVAIDSVVVDALFNFKQYVGSGIIVTLVGTSLAIFIDGFKLNLVKPLKEKLESDFLEKQALAIVALHKCIGEITNSFTADQYVIPSDYKSVI